MGTKGLWEEVIRYSVLQGIALTLKVSSSSVEYPSPWMIFICLTIVLFPDSPVPMEERGRGREGRREEGRREREREREEREERGEERGDRREGIKRERRGESEGR